MKAILTTVLIACLGCNVQLTDRIQEFMPGTYIRASHHEFGVEFDTIFIAIQNQTSNQYSITRNWKYERVLDGQKLNPEYKQIIWSGIYDSKSHILRDAGTNGAYTFDPDRSLLFVGNTEYKKLGK